MVQFLCGLECALFRFLFLLNYERRSYMKLKRFARSISILLVAFAMFIGIAQFPKLGASGCSHPHTMTNYHEQYFQINSYYHHYVVYEETICTECYESLSTVVLPGYPQTQSHGFSVTTSNGIHEGHYSKHHYFKYYVCDQCGYSYSVRCSTGCTANACLEPS